MVGDESEVDGQRLPATTQGLGQVALQGTIESSLQLGEVRECGEQGIVGSGVGGRVAECGAGGGQGDDAAGSAAEHRPQGCCGASPSVVS